MSWLKYIPDPSNQFRRVYVEPLPDNQLKVSWQLKRNHPLKQPIKFQVEYNENYSDPEFWETGAEVINKTDVVLIRPQRSGRINRLGIRVKAIDKNELIVYSFVVPAFGLLTERQWCYILSIIRRHTVYPRNAPYNIGYLLKRRWFGTPCSCRNDITKEIVDTYCEICYGTGIAGGYWKAWEGRLIDVSTKNIITRRDPHLTRGVVDAQVISGVIPAIIPVDVGDVWVNISTDTFYYVRMIRNRAEINGIPVEQLLELGPAEFTDPIYRFPLS